MSEREGNDHPVAREAREQQIRASAPEQLQRFLDKIKFDTSSEEEKLAWLRSADFDQFMDLLCVVNGLLTGQEKFQRWEGKITKSVVSMGGFTTATPDLEPPKEADKEFQQVYLRVQETLTDETVKMNAAKLYTGIIFAHMFPDGNGRLARNVYAMMTGGDVRELATSRSRSTGEFAMVIGGAAMKALIEKEGLDATQYDTYVALHEGISTTDMDILRYIAARRVLLQQGSEVGTTIEITTLDPDTQEACRAEYDQVRREWFWETQRIVEDHADWATEKLDEVVAPVPLVDPR